MVAKKIDILQSIKVAATSADAEQKYEEVIGAHSYIVDFSGNKVEGVAFDVDLAVELRKPAEERLYPVYEAHLEGGEVKYILQLRGAGLWGPIWGYVSGNSDGNSIYGATFGHKGETPGLGAEIENDGFQDQFVGDRKSTRLNSSHVRISYAGFCLKKKSEDAARLGRRTGNGQHRKVGVARVASQRTAEVVDGDAAMGLRTNRYRRQGGAWQLRGPT